MVETGLVKFSYKGSSVLKRVYDVFAVGFIQKKGDINHVVGDFNYAAFFMRKRKTILTIHDLYRLYINAGSPVKKWVIKWFWLRIPISNAVIVTAVSETTRQEVLKYANCHPAKVRVIYNCISPEFMPVPKAFNKEKPVLLQMGTRANKNLPRLIKAIEGLSCKLDIVGSVNAETIQLLNHHKIDFTWKSNLTNQEVLQKYIDADILVFASVFEGFGLPIIEANAVERVVVTGNCSAMAEVAGNAACLVDPLDINSIRSGILKVIEDDLYRSQLIRNGRINKQKFSAEKIAGEYFNLYNELYTKNAGHN